MSGVTVSRKRDFYDFQGSDLQSIPFSNKRPRWEKVTDNRGLDRYVPGSPQLADKDIEQGNYQKALVVLQDALKNDPENDAIKQKIEMCQDEIEKDKQDMTTQEKLNQTLKDREIIQYVDAQATHELADHQMAEGNYRAAFYGLRKAQD